MGNISPDFFVAMITLECLDSLKQKQLTEWAVLHNAQVLVCGPSHNDRSCRFQNYFSLLDNLTDIEFGSDLKFLSLASSNQDRDNSASLVKLFQKIEQVEKSATVFIATLDDQAAMLANSVLERLPILRAYTIDTSPSAILHRADSRVQVNNLLGLIEEIARVYSRRTISKSSEKNGALQDSITAISKAMAFDVDIFNKIFVKNALVSVMKERGITRLVELNEAIYGDYELQADFASFLNCHSKRQSPLVQNSLDSYVNYLKSREFSATRKFRVWLVNPDVIEVLRIVCVVQRLFTLYKHGIEAQFFVTHMMTEQLGKIGARGFSSETISQLPNDWCMDYLYQSASRYYFIDSLRSRIVFAQHQVQKNLPFNDIDLVFLGSLNHRLDESKLDEIGARLVRSLLYRNGLMILTPSFADVLAKSIQCRRIEIENLAVLENFQLSREQRYDPVNNLEREPKSPNMDSFYTRLIASTINGIDLALIVIEESGKIQFQFGSYDEIMKTPAGLLHFELSKYLRGDLALVVKNLLKRLDESNKDFVNISCNLPPVYRVDGQRINALGKNFIVLRFHLYPKNADDDQLKFLKEQSEREQKLKNRIDSLTDKLRLYEVEMKYAKDYAEFLSEQTQALEEELKAKSRSLIESAPGSQDN